MSFLAQFDPPPQGAPSPTNAPPSGWEPTAYAQAALHAEIAQIQAAGEGSRNDTLNRAAFNLIQLVAGGQIPHDTVRVALIDAAHAAGLSSREIDRTIDSGFRKGAQRARLPEPRATPAPLTVLDGPTAAANPAPMPESRRIDWDALWADERVTEWLCEPLIPAGRLVSLYSPPKVGKSLLMLEVAVAISRGAPALGAPTMSTPVLYLDYENADLDVRDRIQNMGYAPDQLAGLHYESFPLLPPLDTTQGGAELLAMALACHAGLVVIDTVSRAVQGDENEASTWLALYRCTLVHLKAAGIAVVRLDHTGKDETRGQRGSSAKSGDVDLVWRLSELVKGNSYLLECEAHRIQMHETLINIERTDNPLTHRVDTRTIGQTRRDAILAALDEAGLPANAGRDRARTVLEAAGLKVTNSVLADLLKRRQGLPVIG